MTSFLGIKASASSSNNFTIAVFKCLCPEGLQSKFIVPNRKSGPRRSCEWDYVKDWNIKLLFLKDDRFLKLMSPRLPSGLPWAEHPFIFLVSKHYDFDPLTLNESLQRSPLSAMLTNSAVDNDAEFRWHFSQSKGLKTNPGPADSFLRANNLLLSARSSQLERSLWLPEGNTRLKWSIVFHGLCPNDWWHFLRHLQRRPPANLEHHLNAEISPP